jgi:Holliday junction resolvasome RuvABC ATP-dependent DNA helicase subunit
MSRAPEMTDDVRQALRDIETFADVLHPKDAEEPILAPTVAHALHEWLVEINNAAELAKVRVQPRRFALLYGPPGTGKTTMAHHIAARLGKPLVAVQSERVISKYVGASGENIGRLFRILTVLENHVVLLLDEFDALGASRSKDKQAAARETNTIVTILLQKIEAFRGIGLAATNTKDAIDPAMWRRFGLQISVDLPGEDERFAIIRKYALPFDLTDEAVDTLVLATRGCSPSLLRQLMEGMKRTLVLAPKLAIDITRPDAVFAHVAASIAPPPEMPQPPLWEKPVDTLADVASIAWPPVRGGA